MDKINNSVQSDYIRTFRLQHKMSVEQLSRELGVTAKTIYRWEHGISNPSRRMIKKFELVLIRIAVKLTPRESEILRLLIEGNSTRKIAVMLYVSEVTIKTHVRNMYKKFGFSNKNQLITYAIQSNL